MHRVSSSITLAAVVVFATLVDGASNNFVPDVVFSGSSLNNWKPTGQANWRAQNGEIIGSGSGGWLMADRSFQDVAVFASFRCAAGCQTGVLLRAERTADGGLKGIFVSLNEGNLATYRVTLDAQGVEKSKERLRAPGGGQLRVAPPPPDPVPNAAPARAGGPPPIPQMPGGIPSPIPRPATALRANEWNTIELVLDANILRAFLNDAAGIGDTVAEPEYGAYGPFALYVGGTGEVRFKDISYKDLQPRVASPEKVSTRFRMQTLNEFYYSWGPAIADFNRDGTPDIVAGPYYYLGPDYNTAREIYIGGTIDPGTQYFNGLQYAYDFTGDGWPDVLNSVFQRPAILYVNPKGESRRWETYTVTDRMSCEFMLLKDVDGDGTPEFLFKDSENRFVYAKPDRANPTGLWTKHYISEPGPWANHGMGVGDVNGDGRADFLNAFGWWEQPARPSSIVDRPSSGSSGAPAEAGSWIYHPAAFGKWTRSSPGGAEMAVYDVNGDGLNDVVTSLQAHGWGLSWFEQKKAADGSRSFVEHPIMTDFSTKNAGGVTFSQLHGATYADVDGDGLQDFITGKRFWSHLDTFIDPDPHGAPVLYVYRTVRNPKAPGGAEFVPELIHNRSGVGSHLAVVDLNKDGSAEIITSTKRGTFIFWNNWKK
jgi:3-keto-disaccharide hydrolase/VCBS repeat protein